MTYEYLCKNPDCSHSWEAKQKISEEPQTTCPQCGQTTAQRLISGRSFILKGSGWFGTGGY